MGVMNLFSKLLPLPLLFSLLLAACGGARPLPPKTVSLRVAGNVPSAQVTIDDRIIGPLGYVARRGVALPPGEHRITVEKHGFFPWDRLIVAEEGQAPIELEIELVPIPD